MAMDSSLTSPLLEDGLQEQQQPIATPFTNGNGSLANGSYAKHDEQDVAVPEGDSPTAQPSNRYIMTCLLGYSLSFIIFGSQVSILGPTIKPLSIQLQVDETDLSPLFTALGVSCIVSGTPSGWLVDRVPTHRVLLGSLLVQAVGFSLVPFMPSVWTLTALYFLICFSYNFTNSAVFTSLGWMFPKRAGSALNLVLAMFGVGSLAIPLAAQACKYLLGSALAVFWVVGITSVLAALPFLFVASPCPPPPLLFGDGPRMFKPPKHAVTLELITTISVVVLVFFTTAAETAIGNWLFTYGVRQAGLSDDEAALGNSAFWGSFTLGRVLGAAVSHLTTPGTLLLCSTPLAMLGASLPLWAAGALSPWHLLMATAVLTGLGNSTGYANAISLLERYVPVTGFVNGLFGMVAGGACMVGPTTVAMLAKYTSLKYSAMAWVGGIFYVLHYPAILTTMLAGRKLLALYESCQPGDEEGGQGEAAVPSGEDALPAPLFAGQLSTAPVPTTSGFSRRSDEVHIREAGRHAAGSHTPGVYRTSSLMRQASEGAHRVIHARMSTSIPGHASPVAVSMA